MRFRFGPFRAKKMTNEMKMQLIDELNNVPRVPKAKIKENAEQVERIILERRALAAKEASLSVKTNENCKQK